MPLLMTLLASILKAWQISKMAEKIKTCWSNSCLKHCVIFCETLKCLPQTSQHEPSRVGQMADFLPHTH